MREVIKEYSVKTKKTIAFFENQLLSVRAGRANPAILDQVTVDYYGTPTPIQQLATVSAPEPRLITVTPYDKNSIENIEKAIMAANIGLNPSNDGKIIRLAVPMLTEENRRNLTKIVKKYNEDAKVALRNERRNSITRLQELEKEKEITEDDLKKGEKDIQEQLDKASAEIDRISDVKISEIMEV